MIWQTMQVMIQNDNFNYPLSGKSAEKPRSNLAEVTVERLEEAKRAIEEHLGQSGFKPEHFEGMVTENPGVFDTACELAQIAHLEAEIN